MHAEDQLDAAQTAALSHKVREVTSREARLKRVGHIVRKPDKKRRRKRKG